MPGSRTATMKLPVTAADEPEAAPPIASSKSFSVDSAWTVTPPPAQTLTPSSIDAVTSLVMTSTMIETATPAPSRLSASAPAALTTWVSSCAVTSTV